jgi:hydrogenase-4 component E
MPATPPSVYSDLANAVGVLLLLIEFGMLRQTFVRDQVRLYAAQSLLVSVLAVVVAAGRGIPELYALAALSFGLKVVIVPAVIIRLFRRQHIDIAGSGAVNVASAVLLAIVVAAFGFFAAGSFDIHSDVLPSTALALSVAVVLVAFVLMVVRRDVASQAIGFFSLENGVSMLSLVVAAGLPLILEVAFLFDLLVAVVVFGVLMRVHHERRSSLSTSDLTGLRG